MNYTENYHLPQWEETDRILRKDFNQMCADIEGGLNDAVRRSEIGLGVANGAIQAEMAERKETGEISDRRIFRLLYNQYLAMQSMEHVPDRMGMFYQNPYNPTTPVSGTAYRNGALYMTAADHNVTADQFFASITTISEMDLVRDDLAACVPLVAAFRTPGPAMLNRIQLEIEYTNKTAMESNPTPFLLELKNMDTGTVEWAKKLTYDLYSATNRYLFDLEFYIPLQGNYQYHLSLIPLAATVTSGAARFHPESDRSTITFYKDFPGATFTQKRCNEEEFQEGVVIVRCKPGGAGKDMTLRWNGTVMQPAFIRELPISSDPSILHWNMQEIFFYHKGPIPIDNELFLTFQCDKDSEFWFYDWGGIFF